MKRLFVLGYMAAAVLCLGSSQQSDSAGNLSATDVFALSTLREAEMVKTLTKYTPLVETYLQLLEPDKELGAVPYSDKYFLGKLDLKKGINDKSLLPEPGFPSRAKDWLTRFFSVQYVRTGFAQMIFVDDKRFDRGNYDFAYVRREFLGEVRCFVFDVKAKPKLARGFIGRIWVEDQNYNIVRFNGTYTPPSGSDVFFHFDSWRENMGPGLWLPAYVYVEESDYRYFLGNRKLRFKGQTRIWGYDIGHSAPQEELTSLSVDSDQVRDDADVENTAPVQNLRTWERLAEDNVLNRLQNAGLLAPEGPANKVLETVLSNIEITNNLDIQPSVRARVLLTTPIESFCIGHTVVLSRGLIDVLPDEASLATVLAHELAHISLGHQIDSKYAFNDRMLFADEETFTNFGLKRDEKEEAAADKKAAEFLQNSPYKDKLGNAGLFLRALNKRSAALPNLLEPHLGNAIARNKKVQRMPDLLKIAPELEMGNVGQIAALPLGSRLKIDPWNDTIELLQAKPVSLLSAQEKMPFEIAPVFLHLTRQKEKASVAAQSVP